jgi:hypothetical protein
LPGMPAEIVTSSPTVNGGSMRQGARAISGQGIRSYIERITIIPKTTDTTAITIVMEIQCDMTGMIMTGAVMVIIVAIKNISDMIITMDTGSNIADN